MRRKEPKGETADQHSSAPGEGRILNIDGAWQSREAIADRAPLIAHVIFRLDVGGLENGLVNLINTLPAERYRHAIICIDGYTDFAKRIKRNGVEIVAIGKRPGTDFIALWRLFTTFRRLRPTIVHTRNLAALDAQLPALLAGVRHRIHSEHGWDVNDLKAKNLKLRILRRLHAPLVQKYIALSAHIRNYLIDTVGIHARKVTQVCNGVDTELFRMRDDTAGSPAIPAQFRSGNPVLIGWVGRMQPVKDPVSLLVAFNHMIQKPRFHDAARLVLVGDGPMRNTVENIAKKLGIAELIWMAGNRDDVPDILRQLDVFVLPSLAEGISNTILEAMASGLPVIACDVGGNFELVDDGKTGTLVDAADASQLSEAIERYVNNSALRREHGIAARQAAMKRFSLQSMVDGYDAVYARMTKPMPDRYSGQCGINESGDSGLNSDECSRK